MNRRTIIAIPVGLVLLTALVALGIYLFSPKQQTVRVARKFSTQRIEQYLIGDELRAEVLLSYLDSCEVASRSSDSLTLENLKNRLSSAIAWRQALDTANLDVAVAKFFPSDSTLFVTIKSVNQEYKELLIKVLRDSSAQMPQRSLPEICSLIDDLGKFFEIRAYYDKRSGLIEEPDNFDGVKWRNVAEHLSKDECHNAIACLKTIHLPDLKVVKEFVNPLIDRYGAENADTITAVNLLRDVPTTVPAQPVAVAPANVKYHSVQKGETLNSIARRYGVTAKELQALNNLSDAAADRLKVDQQIKVPKK